MTSNVSLTARVEAGCHTCDKSDAQASLGLRTGAELPPINSVDGRFASTFAFLLRLTIGGPTCINNQAGSQVTASMYLTPNVTFLVAFLDRRALLACSPAENFLRISPWKPVL